LLEWHRTQPIRSDRASVRHVDDPLQHEPHQHVEPEHRGPLDLGKQHRVDSERYDDHTRSEAGIMRRLAQRLRPRTTREDAGITLVELLIVMLLSSVIMTATVAFFVSVARNTARSVDVTHSTE